MSTTHLGNTIVLVAGNVQLTLSKINGRYRIDLATRFMTLRSNIIMTQRQKDQLRQNLMRIQLDNPLAVEFLRASASCL